MSSDESECVHSMEPVISWRGTLACKLYPESQDIEAHLAGWNQEDILACLFCKLCLSLLIPTYDNLRKLSPELQIGVYVRVVSGRDGWACRQGLQYTVHTHGRASKMEK